MTFLLKSKPNHTDSQGFSLFGSSSTPTIKIT